MSVSAPDGLFFRVSDSVALPGAIKVELRALRPYFGSRVVEQTRIFVAAFPSRTVAIEAGKAQVVRHYAEKSEMQ
ncbi:hypothetical protein ACWGJW_02510 [Streptomyces nigrescens]